MTQLQNHISVKRRSLRTSLLFALLVPNIALFVVTGLGSILIANDATKHAYDDALSDSLRTLARQLKKNGDDVSLDVSPEVIKALEYDDTDSWFFSITYLDGAPIAQNHPLPVQIPANEGISFFDSEIGGQQVRGAVAKIRLEGETRETVVIAQVAETMRGRALTMQRVIVFVCALLAALLLFNVVSILLAIRIIIRPVDKLKDSIAGRTLGNLDYAQNIDVYEELSPLVDAINSLLGRLKAELDSQIEFLGQVAHTLRTRLAGIKLHAQLAARNAAGSESAEAFARIETAIKDLVEEVVKLLMLVRSEQQERKIEGLVPVDLSIICRDVVDSFQITAKSRHIALRFIEASVEAKILGVADSLRILIENLIDNALRFSPIGSTVEVSVIAGDSVKLIVEDSGPGISAQTREKLFRSEYRSEGHLLSDSTGLGLAITLRVAEYHSAEIAIEDSPLGGAKLVVTFPPRK